MVSPSTETPAERLAFVALGTAFFASGTAALIDQTVWQRMLGIFAGSDAVTAAIVVGAFLLGLGVGALVAGLGADRLSPRHAALAFAACELGIGLFALLSKPFLYDFVAGELGPLVRQRYLIFLVSFLGLLLPTFLMGCSLPLLSRAAVSGLAGAARRIGLLYGLNTLGAGVGALAGGWWLVGTIGFSGALVVAASLNLIATLLAVLVAARLPRSASKQPTSANTGLGTDRSLVIGWSLLVFVSGFVIVGLEVLWVRVLGALLQSNAYAFSSILAAFLVADGVGIVIGARLMERVRQPRTVFVLIQAVAVSVAALTLLALYFALGHLGLDTLVGADANRHRGPGLAVALTLVVATVVPPSLLMGLSFPFVQMAVQRELSTVGRRVGLIQVANIVGNALGGLAVGLLMLQWVGTIGTMVVLGLAAVLIVAVELRWARQKAPLGVALALVAVALLLLPGNDRFWQAVHAVRSTDTAYVSEGRSGITVLRLRQDEGPMYIGAFSQSNIPFASWHVLLGVLGPLVHPDPKDVLVIGVGAGGTPYSAGIRPETRRIRAVELVSPVFDVLAAYSAAHPRSAVAAMFADPRLEFVVGDGRHDIFVGARQYDLIQADAIYPESSMSGLLYSREFFQLVRAALKENGIFVLWAPTPRTINTFAAVFPQVVLVAPFAALIGSNQPIPFDPARFAEAVRRPEAVAYLARAGTDASILPAMVAGVPRVIEPGTARNTDINTDMHPRDEFYLTR